MTDAALTVVNVLMLMAGVGGWAAIPILEHVFERDVSGRALVTLLGVSLALVLFGLGVATDNVDLVPVRALAALCLVAVEVAALRESVSKSTP